MLSVYTNLGDPHCHECMNHAYEQVLLPCRWEELHISLSTIVAHHCKAGTLPFAAIGVGDPYEPPIHLEHASCIRFVSFCTVWQHLASSLIRYKVHICSYEVLHYRWLSFESQILYVLIYHI